MLESLGGTKKEGVICRATGGVARSDQGSRAETYPGERQVVPRKQGDVLVVTHGARAGLSGARGFAT